MKKLIYLLMPVLLICSVTAFAHDFTSITPKSETVFKGDCHLVIEKVDVDVKLVATEKMKPVYVKHLYVLSATPGSAHISAATIRHFITPAEVFANRSKSIATSHAQHQPAKRLNPLKPMQHRIE